MKAYAAGVWDYALWRVTEEGYVNPIKSSSAVNLDRPLDTNPHKSAEKKVPTSG